MKDEVARQFCILNSLIAAVPVSARDAYILKGEARYRCRQETKLLSEILANSYLCNTREPGTCLSLKWQVGKHF